MSRVVVFTGALALAALLFGAGLGACHGGATSASQVTTGEDLPPVPRARATGAFRGLWFDGNAELSGYRLTTPRYGELRRGELVLIYVTEPMDRATWVKDDDAPPERRVEVLKLNESRSFLAGIYPYTVMTSTFAPIDAWGGERFAPVKISLTAQEWCGQVFQAVWPGAGRFQEQIASYFADEGDRRSETAVPAGTVYEDALLIQLRELDGPFAGGGDWSGALVPSLWRVRRAHAPAAAVAASIRRTRAEREGEAVTRFVLEAGGYRRTFDVEVAPPHRVLGWTTSDGEEARLLRTTRLPYWTLNHAGDERLRAELGLPVAAPEPPPSAPPGATGVGR